jgi:hypothetical protein
MARISKLTALKADKVKAYGDGGGLFLQVGRYGTKSWVFRFKAKGRLREMGLGSLDTYSLAEARERAASNVSCGTRAKTGERDQRLPRI